MTEEARIPRMVICWLSATRVIPSYPGNGARYHNTLFFWGEPLPPRPRDFSGNPAGPVMLQR